MCRNYKRHQKMATQQYIVSIPLDNNFKMKDPNDDQDIAIADFSERITSLETQLTISNSKLDEIIALLTAINVVPG